MIMASFRESFLDELEKCGGQFQEMDKHLQSSGAYEQLEKEKVLENLSRKNVEGYQKELQKMNQPAEPKPGAQPGTAAAQGGPPTPVYMDRMSQFTNQPGQPGVSPGQAEQPEGNPQPMEQAANVKLAQLWVRNRKRT